MHDEENHVWASPLHLFIQTTRSTDLSCNRPILEQKQVEKTAVLDEPLTTSAANAQQKQAPAALLHGNSCRMRSRPMDLRSTLTCTSLQKPGNWVSSSSSRWASSPLVCLSGKSASSAADGQMWQQCHSSENRKQSSYKTLSNQSQQRLLSEPSITNLHEC